MKNPLSLGSLVNRTILPALNRCGRCGKTEADHKEATHEFERDERIPKWQGWHAARRGLGSNLYRLGVPDLVILVIQRILRHANVSTTATYYIKTAAEDVRDAMAKLEEVIPTAVKAPANQKNQAPQLNFETLNIDSAGVTSIVN